jgi:glycosyltransferase 2 family protein
VKFLDRGLEALDAAGDQLIQLDGRFLLAALALQLANLGFRAVVWRNVLKAAYPERRVPLASVAGSYAAGGALNAFLPARGGELVKLALVRSRIPGSTVPTIAATLTVVLVLDLVLGALLLSGLAAFGVASIQIPFRGQMLMLASLAIPAALVVAVVALRLRPRRARMLLSHLAQGAAVLRTPGRYVRTIVPFQLAAWGCRIGVAFFVLAAFGIQAGLATAALVVVMNGLSTAVPVPGGVGTQQVLAAYALRGVVPLAGAVSFSVGMQVGITTVNTLVGLTALMLMLRTFRPLAAVRSGAGLARSVRPG